jgi:Peptidase M50B-like
VLALAVVASSQVWPVARIVLTIVHEGGHALMALAAGGVWPGSACTAIPAV